MSFATQSLPTSDLFHEASRSADALDESELYLWEQHPLYNYSEPAVTPYEERFTKNMVDVLLGRRWRLAKVARDGRALQFVNGEVQVILHEIADDLVRHIHEWVKVASHVAGIEESGRNRAMAECWLRWQARDILADTEEVKTLQSGDNSYHTY